LHPTDGAMTADSARKAIQREHILICLTPRCVIPAPQSRRPNLFGDLFSTLFVEIRVVRG